MDLTCEIIKKLALRSSVMDEKAILSGKKQNFCPHLGKYICLLQDKGNDQQESQFGQRLMQSKINYRQNNSDQSHQKIEKPSSEETLPDKREI